MFLLCKEQCQELLSWSQYVPGCPCSNPEWKTEEKNSLAHSGHLFQGTHAQSVEARQRIFFHSLCKSNTHLCILFTCPVNKFPLIPFIILTVPIYIKKNNWESRLEKILRNLWWWCEKGEDVLAESFLWATAALWGAELADNINFRSTRNNPS